MRILRRIKRLFQQKGDVKKVNRADALVGENVECVCCGGRFITFLPYGLIKRPNALCPSCGSLERHRLHWHYIHGNLNLMNPKERLRLLHVAPESIFFNKLHKLVNLEYYPCAKFGEGFEDVYPEGTLNIDITQIAFEDNFFDAIYCSHVLEHVPQDRLAMAEMFRVLKPGGWALLQVPLDKGRSSTFEDFSIVDPKEREKAFGQKDHVRVYGVDYKDRLESVGFIVKVDNYTQSFSSKEAYRLGFMKGEDIYLCTKV